MMDKDHLEEADSMEEYEEKTQEQVKIQSGSYSNLADPN